MPLASRCLSVLSKPFTGVPILIAFLAVTFYLFVWDPARKILGDFQVYYEASTRFAAHQNIYQHVYDIVVMDGRHFSLYYFYPPFLALVGSYFVVLFNFTTLKALWVTLSYFAALSTSLAFAQLGAPYRWGKLTLLGRATLALFLTFSFEPLYWGIREGQVNALLLGFIVGHIYCVARGKDLSAGVLLALAALVKMSPTLLLIVPYWLGRWRVFTGFGATVLLSSLVLLLSSTPFSVYKDFFLPFGPLLAGTLERQYVFNFAFDKTLLSAIGLDGIPALRWLVRLLLLALLLQHFRTAQRRDELGVLRAYGLAVIFMMLLSPTVWGHHLVWALIPLFALSLNATYSEEALYRHLATTLGFYVVLGQTMLIHLSAWKVNHDLSLFTALVPGVTLLFLARELWCPAREEPQVLAHRVPQ